MAASVRKGKFGNLYRPRARMRQLRRWAHLTLEQAAEKLGVKQERARQLYFIYNIPRQRHVRGTGRR